MIKNKTILVSGGAGFIGSHLSEKLMANSNFVVIIDNFSNQHTENEKNISEITEDYELKKDYDLIQKDLADTSTFNELDYNFDIIFHLAAKPGVRYSIQNAGMVARNNILSTINIFEYALGLNTAKVVFASSSSVYGNPIYTPVDEEHPKNPISPYAVSKLCGEFYADYYFRENNLQVSSLRFYTVYGPRGRPDMAIRQFFHDIFKNKQILIYGDGNQIRDFTYISDIIDGLILAAEEDRSAGEIFNLGCSNPVSVNQLIDKMYSIVGKPKNIKYIEKQKGDVEITSSKIDKANKILGFKPKYNIDEGLRNTYKWHIENKT
jgi:UDP-glucose 4-epimerase